MPNANMLKSVMTPLKMFGTHALDGSVLNIIKLFITLYFMFVKPSIHYFHDVAQDVIKL